MPDWRRRLSNIWCGCLHRYFHALLQGARFACASLSGSRSFFFFVSNTSLRQKSPFWNFRNGPFCFSKPSRFRCSEFCEQSPSNWSKVGAICSDHVLRLLRHCYQGRSDLPHEKGNNAVPSAPTALILAPLGVGQHRNSKTICLFLGKYKILTIIT